MSMVQLGKHGNIKGVMTNPVKLAIVAYLTHMGGEWTAAQLRGMPGISGHKVKSGVFSTLLSKLRAKGLVRKRINEQQELVWSAGTEDQAAACAKAVEERKTSDAAERKEANTARYWGIPAAPRQNDVMHGPVYVPPVIASHRAGAMDHLQVPSRVGSRRLPHPASTPIQQQSHTS